MNLVFEEREDGDCLNTNLDHGRIVRCHCGRIKCEICETHASELTFELFDKNMRLMYDGSDDRYEKWDNISYTDKELIYQRILEKMYGDMRI